MPDRGLNLTVWLGPTKPAPAPAAVVDALISVEVDSLYDGLDVFRLTFALAKDNPIDYSLLRGDPFKALNRLCLQVRFGVLPEVLIDGIITHHQVQPSNRPGESVLVVSGDDISTRLALATTPRSFPGLTDSDIVTKVLQPYLRLGLRTDVRRVNRKPGVNDRHRVQTGTDLAFIRDLAKENGFIFTVEPTTVPGVSTAYWGPDDHRTEQKPALTMNMGGYTNVDRPVTFWFNALGPEKPVVTVVQTADSSLPVQPPSPPGPPLARRPAEPLRTTELYDTWGLTSEQAQLRMLEAEIESADAVTARGELDLARYGTLVRVRRRVRVRGVGETYNGDYVIRQVTTELRRGAAVQRFVLAREGLGARSAGGA